MASPPVRYTSGVSNRAPTHPRGDMPFFDPTKWYGLFDDFTSFNIAAAGITGWHLDETNTGTPPAVTDAAGGVILVVNDNADNDYYQHQWATNTTVHEIFKVVPGKRAYLMCKTKVEDADQNLIYHGLHIAADDPQGTEPSDQFAFRTLRAAPTALKAIFGKTNSTEVSIDLGTVLDDDWMDLTMYYDGKDTVYAWRLDATGALIASGSASCTTTSQGDLLPDTEMTIAFCGEAMDTGADDMHLDWLGAFIER
jgi:hypothetical protein